VYRRKERGSNVLPSGCLAQAEPSKAEGELGCMSENLFENLDIIFIHIVRRFFVCDFSEDICTFFYS